MKKFSFLLAVLMCIIAVIINLTYYQMCHELLQSIVLEHLDSANDNVMADNKEKTNDNETSNILISAYSFVNDHSPNN